MSSSSCDDSYTFTAKPTASYEVDPTPCTELLAILTEDSIEILYETEVPMTVEGAF